MKKTAKNFKFTDATRTKITPGTKSESTSASEGNKEQGTKNESENRATSSDASTLAQ